MVTTRSANVVVENQTGGTIRAISILHKYSDVHNERYVHAELKHGHSSSGDRVQYNTGFGTTGRDWWLVTWFDNRYSRRYYTDPANFRGIIDSLESIAPSVIQVAVAATAAVAATSAGPVAQAASATAAAEVASKSTDALFNSESTDGFKQHILRGEDENNTVRIILRGNGKVRITSPSGNSDTEYSTKSV